MVLTSFKSCAISASQGLAQVHKVTEELQKYS